jgi:hypothetical protein
MLSHVLVELIGCPYKWPVNTQQLFGMSYASIQHEQTSDRMLLLIPHHNKRFVKYSIFVRHGEQIKFFGGSAVDNVVLPVRFEDKAVFDLFMQEPGPPMPVIIYKYDEYVRRH